MSMLSKNLEKSLHRAFALAGERRHECRAIRTCDVLVPEQAQVHVPHRGPPLHRVRQGGVEIVRPRVVDDAEVRESLLLRRASAARL